MVDATGGAGSLSQVLTNTNQQQNTTSNQYQTGAQSSASTANQQGTFLPNQIAMQGQASNLLNQILTGDLQNFGPPQAAYDAAFANYNKYQAPQLAAQGGSGSPAIGAGMQELQQQMAGMWSTMALPNALNAFNSAAQYAFNPTGQVQTSNNNQLQNLVNQGNQNTTGNTSSLDVGGLLGGLASFL